MAMINMVQVFAWATSQGLSLKSAADVSAAREAYLAAHSTGEKKASKPRGPQVHILTRHDGDNVEACGIFPDSASARAGAFTTATERGDDLSGPVLYCVSVLGDPASALSVCSVQRGRPAKEEKEETATPSAE